MGAHSEGIINLIYENGIETELLPPIDATYRTTPYRILVGHSFGGLFAFHALVSRPDLFDAYIAVDPSLWWNNGAPLEQLNQFLEANPDIDKTLFVSDAAGAEHLIDRANEADRRVSNLTNGAMTDYERYATDHAPVGFRWGYARYPSDSHNAVVHQSVYDGLGLVFADMDMLAVAANASATTMVIGVTERVAAAVKTALIKLCRSASIEDTAENGSAPIFTELADDMAATALNGVAATMCP